MRETALSQHVQTMGRYTPIPPGARKDDGVQGASAVEVDAWYAARRDAQPSSVSCGLCDWPGLEGTAGECREAALKHRKAKHPKAVNKKRAPGSGLGTTPALTSEQRQAARVRGAAASAKRGAA